MADKLIINCETGEEQVTSLTKAEQAQRDRDIAAQEAREQEEAARHQDADAKREALRQKLGLTVEEWELLRG